MTAFEQQLRELVRSILREELAAATPTTPDHVTVAEYARARSISESTVRVAIREGRLEVVRIGRAVRVPRDAAIGKRAKAVTVTDRARLKLLGGGR